MGSGTHLRDSEGVSSNREGFWRGFKQDSKIPGILRSSPKYRALLRNGS